MKTLLASWRRRKSGIPRPMAVFVYGVQASPQILEQCSPAVFLESAVPSARHVRLLLENLRFLYYAISNPLLFPNELRWCPCVTYNIVFPSHFMAFEALAASR